MAREPPRLQRGATVATTSGQRTPVSSGFVEGFVEGFVAAGDTAGLAVANGARLLGRYLGRVCQLLDYEGYQVTRWFTA